MADKSLTQSQIVDQLATANGLTKVQVRSFLESQSALAYKNAKNGFTIPGLGKLVLVNRKARMGRNPATGEAIKIPAKKVVKFRVAKAAKEAIGGVAPKKAAAKKKKEASVTSFERAGSAGPFFCPRFSSPSPALIPPTPNTPRPHSPL